MLKLNPNTDDVYGPLQRFDDAFSHESHVGAVTSMDWSPFHRFGFSQNLIFDIIKFPSFESEIYFSALVWMER